MTLAEQRVWQLLDLWHSRTESRLAIVAILTAAAAFLIPTFKDSAAEEVLWVAFGLLLGAGGLYWVTLSAMAQALAAPRQPIDNWLIGAMQSAEPWELGAGFLAGAGYLTLFAGFITWLFTR